MAAWWRSAVLLSGDSRDFGGGDGDGGGRWWSWW